MESRQSNQNRLGPLIIATILTGIGAGLSGMSLALLLHYIQHIAYGYSPTAIISNETFLDGVRASSSLRRVFILGFCGLIAGFGWWSILRFGKPLVSIANAIQSKQPRMPLFSTLVHVLLQIITIALGSPLGREVAPRELSALCASWIGRVLKLDSKNLRLMMACAAGAGLAAVYNVPLGGALFTLEVLLVTLDWSVMIPAFATSIIAVVISWLALGNVTQYHIPAFHISTTLVIWSIFSGPLFGFCAYFFHRYVIEARQQAPHDARIILFCLFNFLLLGLCAMYFPSLLGNGKSPAELAFSNNPSYGF